MMDGLRAWPIGKRPEFPDMRSRSGGIRAHAFSASPRPWAGLRRTVRPTPAFLRAVFASICSGVIFFPKQHGP